MHINSWVQASDLMKMMKSANSISTFSSEEGLPDNHVITIRERELTVDFPELIQNNIKTDTVTLDLDAEWDGIHPVIIFGPNASGTIAVEYTGEPVHIPGAVMQYVGGLDCSVMGLDDSGEVRLVTKAAPNTFEVVESGEYIGQISEDDVSLLGQILSAIEDVETATSDASTAAEAATSAANSANTAATKATAAANSANTAATKATDAANSANTASERAENAYDVLTPIIAEIGVNGNQPRATTNPNHVATASDAYAAKPLGISIKGATRQNLWVNPSGTNGGVTVTSNEDGSMTISGTNSTSKDIYIQSDVITAIPYGKQLTVSSSNYGESGKWRLFLAGIGVGTITEQKTFLAEEGSKNAGRVSVVVTPGTTINATVRVMLNEGSTAQPWCPPGLNSVGDGGSVEVVTAGKNLVSTSESSATNFQLVDYFLPAGEYTLSIGDKPDGFIFNIRAPRGLGVGTSDDTVLASGSSSVITFALDYASPLYINGYTTLATPLQDIQLELGSTATDYEPPNITTTPIDLDGNTLCSLPDGTHDELTIDATGAVTLTKRTGTYIANGDEGWELSATSDAPYRMKVEMWSEDVKSALLRINQFQADRLPKYPSTPAASSFVIVNGQYQLYAAISGIQDASAFSEWLESNPMTLIYPLAEPQTIPLSPVTLPMLPSPNITVYHDSDVPSDITVEYVQDINIVLDNLNAKIAALNVAQSSSS